MSQGAPGGLAISPENALGFIPIWCHYSTDPDKWPENPDPVKAEAAQKWLELQRKAYPDPNDFAREFEISWWVGKGTRVFPQFTERVHMAPLQHRRGRVVYRGWDFGFHAPVILAAQIDTKDRLLVLREMVGSQTTTSDFAHRVIKDCAAAWPQNSAGYEDFCDPAGQQIKSVESEKSERRDVEVLNGMGIFPKYEWGWSRKDGRSLVHQLLQVRTDGSPGLLVDPAGCPILAQAFLGRYVYPETKDGKVHEDPDDKTHPYADVMAALRYLVTGLHQKLGLRRPVQNRVPTTPPTPYTGYGLPVRSSRER